MALFTNKSNEYKIKLNEKFLHFFVFPAGYSRFLTKSNYTLFFIKEGNCRVYVDVDARSRTLCRRYGGC